MSVNTSSCSVITTRKGWNYRMLSRSIKFPPPSPPRTGSKTTSVYGHEYYNLILKCVFNPGVRRYSEPHSFSSITFFHSHHGQCVYIVLIVQWRDSIPDISEITVIPSFSIPLLLSPATIIEIIAGRGAIIAVYNVWRNVLTYGE